MRSEISLDPASILKAPDLDVVPYAERVSALADRLGLDFSATLFALETIPLCQARERHPAVRRAMAELIAERSDPIRVALPGMVAQRLAPMTRPGHVDMVPEVIAPLVSDMISALIGIRFEVALSESVSRVFSQAIGVAKRRRMEDELARLVATLRSTFAGADDALIGQKLSLAILGRDALVGTIGCSLRDLLAVGQPYDQITWPDLPPRTGVPYIDRVALHDVRVGDMDLDAGATVRARLADYEGAPEPRARLSFFGAGAHLCLGRALSLDLWREICGFLGKSPLRPKVSAFALRRDDVFHIPEDFQLEITLP